MTRSTLRPAAVAACLAGASLAILAAESTAADARFWTLKPYAVRVRVAVDARSVASGMLADRVAERLVERADASIGALWDLSVEPLRGIERLDAMGEQARPELLAIATNGEKPCDKLITVLISEGGAGFSVRAVECDPLLEIVGEPLRLPEAPLEGIGDAAFAAVVEVFSPVALFEVERGRKSDGNAKLSFRGSGLPGRPGQPRWATAGRVLLPVLRRTDREGRVVEDGILAAPWTYFLLTGETAADLKAAGEGKPESQRPGLGPAAGATTSRDERLVARVYSHTKQPFGTRRRGRVEQYALLLRPLDARTRVRLHVRDRPDEPLVGYEVYVQDGDEDKRTLLGSTDSNGVIEVRKGASPMQIVFVKSGSQVVAKAPTPVGFVPMIEIPLRDERERLNAEAKLALLREELIDLIAQRSILAARIRNAISAEDWEAAAQLLQKLESKPGESQLSRKLDRLRQRATSSDQVVQQRIDKQFADTAIVVGAFLAPEQVAALRRELDDARRGAPADP